MTAPNTPPTGTGTGKVPSPPGWGARVLTVIDTTPSVHVSACLAWVHSDRYLCHLPRNHKGSHLEFPLPWPRRANDDPSSEPIDRSVQ